MTEHQEAFLEYLGGFENLRRMALYTIGRNRNVRRKVRLSGMTKSDLVQETFMFLVRNPPASFEYRPSTYICNATVWAVHAVVRKLSYSKQPCQFRIDLHDVRTYEPIEGEFDLSDTVESVINTLTPRERKIIRRRFGFDGVPQTFLEVGKAFGVSKERVRQIECKAIRKLQHHTRAYRFLSFLPENDPMYNDLREYAAKVNASN